MKRSPMKRGTSQMKRSPMKRGTSTLGPGKKTKRWEFHRAKLKKIFERNGVTMCEARFQHGCMIDDQLGFAHPEKRRNITDDQQLATDVAVCCNPAHKILDEGMTHDAMRLAVNLMIHDRGWKPEYDVERQTLTGRVVLLAK